jgi:hypothetical protein
MAPGTALAILAVFCVALALLAVPRGGSSAERLPRARAASAALADPEIRAYLSHSGYTRYRVTPLDRRLVRVSFFDGPKIVLDAAVAPDGNVPNRLFYRPGYVRAGSEAAQRPWMLLLFSALFLLATATLPLLSLRNLDVLVLASFVLPIVLLNARLFEASVYASYPQLAYLAVRSLQVAFGRERRQPAGTPLYERLTGAWDARVRRRMLWGAVGGAGMALVLLSVPGGLVGDVAFASMAGATDLLHGTLPYGHLPQGELVHGDTYPLLAYAAYLPAALVAPVNNAFDNLDGALYVAAAFALVAAAALYIAGRRAAAGSSAAGLRVALAWLCFPPVLIAASSGSNDMAAAACVAIAAALISYPGGSSVALALAGWIKLGPLLVLPAWSLRWRSRALWKTLIAAAAVTAAVAVWVAALGGLNGFADMLDAVSFQAERGSLLSLWTLTGAKALQVVLQAALVTLVVLGAYRVRSDRALADDPRRIFALAAAILLGVQIVANYWTYAYLPWVFPLIALALLRERPRSASGAA